LPPVAGRWAERMSPADGSLVARLARSDETDVERAATAARRAQSAWADRTPVDRGIVIRRSAELLRENGEELAALVCEETGKPRRDSQGEVAAAIEMGYFVAGEGRRLYGRTTTSAVLHKTVLVVRSPIGVAGLIVAANTPLPNYAWKVFPALLCGNTALLKPSEHTPASGHRFAELLHDAGLPPGVLNVVQGFGHEAGSAIVGHPEVDIVSFTGSCTVGRQVQSVAGSRLAKVCLELGGKNPLVVCDDADLRAAARAAALSAFSNAGQRCASGSRLLVFKDVYDEFRELLLAETEALRVGSGKDADLGPVVSTRALESMLAALERAQSSGAKVATGGHRMIDPPLDKGCYLAPTIVEGADPSDEISTAELFGPIVCLYRVGDFNEAIALANDSPFGLTASIHTLNVHRAMTFVDRMQAGMVVVNGPTYGSEPHMPFGGFKQSGNGFREAGTEALDVYSDWKSAAIIHDPGAA
jgi:acyl-CoA reductase-like NAD-dependent aldehyde dehydrogenase